MPGSLLEGYMAGKRYLQEREEKEEEGKREKLNDQIRELEFKRLTRGLERSAEEWEQQKTQYGQAQADRERGIRRSDVEWGQEQTEWGQEQADRERQQAALERVRAGSRDPIDLQEAGFKIEKKAGAGGLKMGTVPVLPGYGFNPATGQVEEAAAQGGIEEALRIATLLETTQPGLADSLNVLAGDQARGKFFGPKVPETPQTDFYGAKSYEEVEQETRNLPKAKRDAILVQAKQFFGIQ